MYLDVENRQLPDALPPYEQEPARMAHGINHHASGSTFMDNGDDRISSSHNSAPPDEIPSSGDTDVTGKIKKILCVPQFSNPNKWMGVLTLI
jgi:hypothetical protein